MNLSGLMCKPAASMTGSPSTEVTSFKGKPRRRRSSQERRHMTLNLGNHPPASL
jgi:hypothetical protein